MLAFPHPPLISARRQTMIYQFSHLTSTDKIPHSLLEASCISLLRSKITNSNSSECFINSLFFFFVISWLISGEGGGKLNERNLWDSVTHIFRFDVEKCPLSLCVRNFLNFFRQGNGGKGMTIVIMMIQKQHRQLHHKVSVIAITSHPSYP